MKEAAELLFKKKEKKKKKVLQVCRIYANSSLQWLAMKMHL